MRISSVPLDAWRLLLAFCTAGLALTAQAEIKLSTSSILIARGQQETSIDVQNQGEQPVLLYSKIVKVSDDDLAGGVLYTLPQVIMVDPGRTQTVRVIYRGNTTLDREHFARATFSGIPPLDAEQRGKINLVLSQELPVVLGVDPSVQQKDLWELVRFRFADQQLCLNNPTRKVFRLDPRIGVTAPTATVQFAKPYVLPGEELCAATPVAPTAATRLQVSSVSNFNYIIARHEVRPALPATQR